MPKSAQAEDAAVMTPSYSDWRNANPLRAWRATRSPRVGLHEAGGRLGVGVSTIQTWESGSARPNADNMLALAAMTGIANIEQAWDTWLTHRP
jgi:transcriptional regulator with XRE-family HTH domain